MKEISKTIVREFDDKGNVIKETETTIEKDYQELQYVPQWKYVPHIPSTTPIQPFIWPNPTITCDCVTVKNRDDIVVVASQIATSLKEMGCK